MPVAETWEECRDREKRESIDAHERLARGVGGSVELSDEYRLPIGVTFRMESGAESVAFHAHFDKRRGRWDISPQSIPGGVFVGHRKSITVSAARDGAAILRDVRNRLLPDAVAWLEKCRKATEDRNEWRGDTQASIDAIQAACVAGGIKFQEGRNDSPDARSVWVGGAGVRVSGKSLYVERLTFNDPGALVAAIRGACGTGGVQ